MGSVHYVPGYPGGDGFYYWTDGKGGWFGPFETEVAAAEAGYCACLKEYPDDDWRVMLADGRAAGSDGWTAGFMNESTGEIRIIGPVYVDDEYCCEACDGE